MRDITKLICLCLILTLLSNGLEIFLGSASALFSGGEEPVKDIFARLFWAADILGMDLGYAWLFYRRFLR